MSDVWAAGDAYEPYIGRWSRGVAETFVDWLAVAPKRRWLDVGCGTGALTAAILARCAPAEVLGIDPSEGFVAWAAAHVTDPRARFAVGDATQLPASADIVVSGLLLNFVPDPAAAVAAMRGAAPEGVVAAYVWDYGGRMDMLRHFWDAAAELDPSVRDLDEAARFAMCRPERLEALWRGGGMGNVTTRDITIPTVFRDFDDFWSPFLGGQGPAAGYAMSLDEDGRRELRERIRAQLPIAADGSISLIARAWAVHGRSM